MSGSAEGGEEEGKVVNHAPSTQTQTLSRARVSGWEAGANERTNDDVCWWWVCCRMRARLSARAGEALTRTKKIIIKKIP